MFNCAGFVHLANFMYPPLSLGQVLFDLPQKLIITPAPVAPTLVSISALGQVVTSSFRLFDVALAAAWTAAIPDCFVLGLVFVAQTAGSAPVFAFWTKVVVAPARVSTRVFFVHSETHVCEGSR